ncbi:MAG: hypothetical protein A4S17_05930 [Proteobacteria bacterium HN_bin10]|jgi:tetratricopeptide (TPR) repeat protein|nr:MAG: hypothetical protein A4S17_05930 [Proteobacteria bacterium HN_bin10]
MDQRQLSVTAEIERAMALIRGGRSDDAVGVLDAILERKPSQPDALQLRGYICQLAGRWAEAVDFYRASLKANNNQPPVHNNLGLALAAGGALEEAEKSYRRALALDPNYLSAACNLASLLVETDRLEEAEAVIGDALSNNATAPRALELMGVLLLRRGRAEEAVAFAARAAELAPASPSAFYNLAQAQLAVGASEAARVALFRAVQNAPASDQAWTSLGYASALCGKAEEAINALGRAIAINPSNADAHRLLNDQVWQSSAAGYLNSYKSAISMRPADVTLRLEYADRLLQIQDYEAAHAQLEEALRSAPDDARVRDLAARVAASQGDFARAVLHHRRATELAPNEPALARNYAETLLRSGDAPAAIDQVRGALAHFPLDQGLLAYYCAGLQQCGDPRHDEIADYAALPTAIRVEPPEGYPDIETFNVALAACLRALHTMRQNPTEQTLRGGTQTAGSLFRPNQGLILSQLQQQLRKAVSTYISMMPAAPGHPFFGRKAADFRFSGSWSVCLKRSGFHTNHFHPGGWISSAYYVETPKEAQFQEGPGWFKMGETHMGLPGEAIQRLERPDPGKLVLFPSYFWHGTIPFEADAERLTVAFDIVPS